MLPKPRESQNWVDRFQSATPQPELQGGWGKVPTTQRAGEGGRFVAERKGEAWTMSQSPPPLHTHTGGYPSLRLLVLGNFPPELNTTEAFPWELECVCVHRAADWKHRKLQLETLPGRLLCNPSVVYSRLGTHFYPPLHTHASWLKQGETLPPPPPEGQPAVPAAEYLHIPPWRQTDGTVD